VFYRTILNRDTIALLVLARKLKINPVTLLVLYDKYKKEIFYFWYMLAGFNNLPTIQELYNIIRSADRYTSQHPKWLEKYIDEEGICISLEEVKI